MANGRLIRLPKKQEYNAGGPSDASSIIGAIVAPSARDTLKYLQELAGKLPYSDFLTLKVQVFERCRALAISDVFEDMDDEERLRVLNTKRDLAYYRNLPEYGLMCETLIALAPLIDHEHEKMDGKEFIEKNRALLQRKLLRLIKEDAGDSPQATRLLSEVLERVLPAKESRTTREGANIRPTPEFENLLREALDVTEKAKAKAKEKKP